jgi:hypothetical protein
MSMGRNLILSLLVAGCPCGAAVAGDQPPLRSVPAVAAPTGTTATCNTWCAAINADGSIARAHAFTTASHLITGEYQVLFYTSATAQKNISKCVWLATPGLPGFVGSQPATIITTAGRLGTTNGVYVATYDATGAPVDAPFLLELSC